MEKFKEKLTKKQYNKSETTDSMDKVLSLKTENLDLF